MSLPPVKIAAGDENFYFCEVFYSRAENGKIIEAKNISRFPENGVLTINGILEKPKKTSTYAAVDLSFVKIIYISAACLFLALLTVIIFVTFRRSSHKNAVPARDRRSKSFLAREKAEKLLVDLPEN